MEKISVIGIGKLGLAFALNADAKGFNVIGVDINQKYIDCLNNKIITSYEPGIKNLLINNNNFVATSDLYKAIVHSNNIFLVVATPTDPLYGYDHSQINNIVNKLIGYGKQKTMKHLIISCTVVPGYTDSVYKRLQDYGWEVSYNPEFIAQGQIIQDQLNPDIILIGQGNEFVGKWLKDFYFKFCDNNPKFHIMERLSAEITKLSLNCFLTTKIAYANMIGDICIIAGAEQNKVLKAIGDDSRIGPKYLKYGYGYGGPCFPRDNKTLARYADTLGYEAKISKANDESNNQHLDFMVKQKSNIVLDTFIFNTVTYKKGTTIIEESQQLLVAVTLANMGYKVIIKEHLEVIKQVKELYGDLFIYEETSTK